MSTINLQDSIEANEGEAGEVLVGGEPAEDLLHQRPLPAAPGTIEGHL